jgi:hypothetical protein
MPDDDNDQQDGAKNGRRDGPRFRRLRICRYVTCAKHSERDDGRDEQVRDGMLSEKHGAFDSRGLPVATWGYFVTAFSRILDHVPLAFAFLTASKTGFAHFASNAACSCLLL